MILTTDALVGGTIIASLVTATLPITMKAATKAVDVRRDLVAEHVAAACNVALFQEETLTTANLNKLLKKGSVSGECGVRGNLLNITWDRSINGSATRQIKFDRDLEVYVMG